MIIGSAVVAVVAVGALIAALSMNNGDDDAKGSDSSASASVTAVEGHRDGDTSKTIATTACKEPEESYNDPSKIQVPDFQFKYIASVKSCLQAAGWKVKIKSEDENTYGQGTVMDQFPAAGTDVDPKDMPQIQLGVSTGNPS